VVGENLLPQLARTDVPEWLQARRAQATERFATTELPTVDEEVWRYSRIDELDLDSLVVPTADIPVPKPTPYTFDVLNGQLPQRAATVIVRNGRVVGVEVDERWASKGLHAGPATADHVHLLGAALARPAGEQPAGDGGSPSGGPVGSETAPSAEPETRSGTAAALGEAPDPFITLNDAGLIEPVVVDVPEGVFVDAPVVVVHVTEGDRTLSCPRLVVHAGPSSAVSVVEVQVSSDDHSLVVPLTEIVADRAANVGHVTLQQLGLRTWQIGSQVSRVDTEATFRSTSIGFGGDYARLRTDCHMVGRGATGELDAIYFGEGDQTLDFRTFQEHLAPDTTSNLLFKGAVGGRSRSVYTGMIRVAKSARGTNAFQTNRNIKLSDHAWAESVPNLVIENNDVHCSHASAVGPIDEEQRFYLESRGVPTDVAERLIVGGFFGEVFAKLPVPGLAPLLARTVGTKFERREA
jgi:Fe-S cluster assembly protein SufD